MKQVTKLAILLGLSLSLSTYAYAIEIVGGGKILDHTSTVIGGTGSYTEKPYTGKKKLPKSHQSSCYAAIDSIQEFINEAMAISGQFNFFIQNDEDTAQVYEIEEKVSTSDNRENDNVWHISLDPGAHASNSSMEDLTVQYPTIGTWESYADLYVRGIDGCENHDQAYITVINEKK